MSSKHHGCYNSPLILVVFLREGDQGTSLLCHAHDEVNRSEFRTQPSQNERKSNANTSQIRSK